MAKIRDQWGRKIRLACTATRVPEALLAAIIANESSGDARAESLEEGILKMLTRIKSGLPVPWYPLTLSQIEGLSDLQLEGYATGMGLTQITGYHIFPENPSVLLDPARNLSEAVVMLLNFARRWRLGFNVHQEVFLHCWNGGSPKAATYSPLYVPSGMERMKVYEDLTAARPPAKGEGE